MLRHWRLLLIAGFLTGCNLDNVIGVPANRQRAANQGTPGDIQAMNVCFVDSLASGVYELPIPACAK